jgi:hypothetical protein
MVDGVPLDITYTVTMTRGTYVFVPALQIPQDLSEAQQIDQFLHKEGSPVGDHRGFSGWYVTWRESDLK